MNDDNESGECFKSRMKQKGDKRRGTNEDDEDDVSIHVQARPTIAGNEQGEYGTIKTDKAKAAVKKPEPSTPVRVCYACESGEVLDRETSKM